MKSTYTRLMVKKGKKGPKKGEKRGKKRPQNEPKKGQKNIKNGEKMGKGRKRLPTKLKAMQGTLEKSRITENEMEVAQVKSMPMAPVILEGFAIDVWQKTTNELFELGMLHNVDLELLSAYCYEMGVYFEMAELLKKGKRRMYIIQKAN